MKNPSLRLSAFVPRVDRRFGEFGLSISGKKKELVNFRSYNREKNIPSISRSYRDLSIRFIDHFKSKKEGEKSFFFFFLCDETKMSVVGNDPTFDFPSKSGETKSGERQGEREIPIKPRI